MSPLNEPTNKLPRNYGVPDAWQQDREELKRLRAEVVRLREMLGKKIGQDFDSIDAMSARLHRIEEAVREVIALMTSPAVSRRSLRLAARLRATLEEKP